MKHMMLGLALAGLAATTLACNLSRQPPTPTAAPTLAASATVNPNLIPSVTPIGFPAATALPGTPAVCAVPGGWFPYVVQPGDTLTDLALRSNNTVAELVARNCLASADAIFVGQTLYMPVQLPPSG